MTASLAYRKNEAAILRGDVPAKYTRILPHVPGDHVLEIGSAEGVLACLMANAGKQVTALEMRGERQDAAIELCNAWISNRVINEKSLRRTEFVVGSIVDRLDLLSDIDTVVAVRVIYYFREHMDHVFAAVAAKVPNVVLCGNRNRADAWRAGLPHAPLGEWNRYASAEGMRDVLERHGYSVTIAAADGDEIVVGRRG